MSVTLVHGPFTKLGSGRGRHKRKTRIQEQISNGECECRLCREHGQRGMPDPALWSSSVGEEGEIYLCQGPADLMDDEA